MANAVRCPVCGVSNPDELERCRACNQLLKQSTKELNGFGDRIASGQTPTEKRTSELESALPAWLRRARQTDDQDDVEEAVSTEPDGNSGEVKGAAPVSGESESVFPDFFDENEEDEEENAGDWLAGLASSADDEDDDEDSADWLKNLQGDLPVEEEVEEEMPSSGGLSDLISGDESEDVNWLSNLQDTDQAADELPDLLIPQEETEETVVELPGEDGVPDWLSRLSEEAETDAVSHMPEIASAPQMDAQPVEIDAESDLPDWLGNLQSVGEVSGDEFPTNQPEKVASTPVDENLFENDLDSDLPEWVANLQSADDTSESSEGAVTDFGELPAWMMNLQGEEEAVDVPAVSAAPSDDLPDWLSGDEPVADSAQAEEDSHPDWMASTDETEEISVADTPTLSEESAQDLPDWLSGSADAAEDASASAADELPSWMSASEDDDVSETAETDLSTELPSWMSDLPAGEEEEESPEWLAGGDDEATPVEDASAPKPAFDTDILDDVSDDLPDWMAGLQEDALETVDVSQQDFASIAETSAQESVSTSEDVAEAADEADVPDWLSRVGKPVTGSLAASNVFDETEALDLTADETPGWLDALPGIDNLSPEDDAKEDSLTPALNPAFVSDAEAGEGADEEIFGIDMPDWLSNLAPEDIGTGENEAFGAPSAKDDLDLSGAELPSWVQAMRPVESVVSASDLDDGSVVIESGPLAGLSGILPVGVGVGPKNKPKAHALKLRVNESQQHGALLLEQILNSEGKAAPKASEDIPVSVPLLRWLIAGLMLLVLIGALLLPNDLVASPNIVVPEVGKTLNTINSLPENGTVLVVFDYEAALSAELQATGSPVVDHIMLRGQKLALLSSSANGPALAERFITETQSQHNYQLGSDYVNLGYLPGGASGILSFISAPNGAVIGQVNGQSFWNLPVLAGIAHITDFSAVLILTDDVEKGRAWIEQASAVLHDGGTPLLMAVSAQAEPVIYPYYASAQVDGLVSGLNGGATYERLQGQRGLGREYWDAYSVGLLTAEILIVLGAVLNFMAGVRARKNIETEEE